MPNRDQQPQQKMNHMIWDFFCSQHSDVTWTAATQYFESSRPLFFTSSLPSLSICIQVTFHCITAHS